MACEKDRKAGRRKGEAGRGKGRCECVQSVGLSEVPFALRWLCAGALASSTAAAPSPQCAAEH